MDEVIAKVRKKHEAGGFLFMLHFPFGWF